MTVRVVAVVAALATALVPCAAAAPSTHGAAATAKRGKHVKRASARCGRARCAVVRHRKRRLAARAPLERLLGVGPGPSLDPSPGQPQGPEPGAPTPPRFVSVAAREFSLTLSRPLVGAGSVTVELRNSGEDPHNLVVSPEGSHSPLVAFSELDPGAYERRSVTLSPGRYQLWCSIESHEDLGMSATLRVD
jgi:hypothetical protein